MHYIFDSTALHGRIWVKDDPGILIRQGYHIDSKRAWIKLFPHKPLLIPSGFLSLKPETSTNRSIE